MGPAAVRQGTKAPPPCYNPAHAGATPPCAPAPAACAKGRPTRNGCFGGCCAAGGSAAIKFRRQHVVGPYILDFYCAERRLAVELDGGQHNEAENRRRDEARTAYLEERGIMVLRYSNLEALRETEAVLEAIGRHAAGRRPASPPKKERM